MLKAFTFRPSNEGIIRELKYIEGEKVEFINIPVIKLKEIEGFHKSLFKEIDGVTHVTFTSANCVRIVSSALRKKGLWEPFVKKIIKLRVAAIGPETAKALGYEGIKVNLIPKDYTSLSLAKSLYEDGASLVLAIRSKERTQDLNKECLRLGIKLKEIFAYEVNVNKAMVRNAVTMILKEDPSFLIFTSPTSFSSLAKSSHSFKEHLLASKKVIIALGPTTARKISEYGIKPLVPFRYDMEGVKELMERLIAGHDR